MSIPFPSGLCDIAPEDRSKLCDLGATRYGSMLLTQPSNGQPTVYHSGRQAYWLHTDVVYFFGDSILDGEIGYRTCISPRVHFFSPRRVWYPHAIEFLVLHPIRWDLNAPEGIYAH